MKKRRYMILVPFLLATAVQVASAVDFLFNGFSSSDVSLYGVSTVESRILTLTNDTNHQIGRGLYPSPIPTKQPNSSLPLPFHTSFIFAMAPYAGKLPGHGIVFLLVPHLGIDGATSAQHLGLFNFTNNGDPYNHVFGVEFDVFKNDEFGDINANHVGVDVNSLASVQSHEAGYWPESDDASFKTSPLNNGKNYQVWIDYVDGTLNVTMSPLGINRPNKPLLTVPLNLTPVLLDEMYVGFTASTGALVQSHKILSWSFSNTNSSLSDSLITSGLPNFELPKTPFHKTRGFIAGLSAGLTSIFIVSIIVAFLLIKRNREIQRRRAEMEDWELEYWPHRISYQEIESATNNFSEQNVIGLGGNGKVYKGTLPGGAEIAVKRISHDSGEGIRAFLAEISTLGRLKHRNLVGLRGWCKKEKGSLIVVYEYMENGSLDKFVFEMANQRLSFQERIRILKQVASGLLYLHHGWEAKVLHRDIKASNVLLDKEMNARLGDFGLARMHDHDKVAGTTRVVGTVGYLAPEVVTSGRASTQTDVFGYGVLLLEVMCGRRPIEEGAPPLLDWAWELLRRGELMKAVDVAALRGGTEEEAEVERVLHVGLLCAHPDPKARPSMRQVVKFLEERGEVNEAEMEEDMQTHLLDKMKTDQFWSMYPHFLTSGSSSSSHPTFEDFRKGMSQNTMSLSWSTTIVEDEEMSHIYKQ
ncbi:L-type lectin-domain containing receptor kinase VII.1-like isoform X2 [Salvia splendens]|uniref:L-type lectin-domain containing receptor kinase VII.1-like isoform X2 n=1 Tax=Salvia splendens TaxID=180675 RepID=UPI001C2710B6|nr:L-type lectin-domain containing receptor kinase VII.1-like isoform X2 [Salvia splendens]